LKSTVPPTPVRVEPLESRRLLTTLPSGFAETLITDAITGPTAMAVAPDGRLFVAEQAGRLRVVKNGQLLSTPFASLDVQLRGERGLVGVELDPDFSSNHYVYVYYTPAGSNGNRVSRFTANGDVAAAGSERVLFQIVSNGGEASIHQGGAMHFGADGKLYVAVGDHGDRKNAQSVAHPRGKMLRLNKDGSIPTDNPFYNQATGQNRAIWAVGLRNPFTFAIQPGTGWMLINDVGETSWEEINEGRAGANYGWPDAEGRSDNPDFTNPIYTYSHADGKAIVGGTFYNPPAGAGQPFPASYAGDYFFMDFGRTWIRRLDNGRGTPQEFATRTVGKGVDLDVGPDGSLYYLARGVEGVTRPGVFRIRYTGSNAPNISQQPTSRTVSVGQPATFSVSATGTGTLTYQWQRNGTNISGATGTSYTLPSATLADNGAKFRAIVRNSAGSVTSNEATLTVTSNRAPAATITSPSSGTLYSGGTVINYAGTGTDPEDGTLPASAFTWVVEFHHDDHAHPFLGPITNTKSGSFTVPRDGELSANVWYRIHLTVRDSDGLTHSTFRDVKPVKATITVAASVPGLKLTLDEQPVTAPLSVTGVAGITRSLGAPATQVLNGTTYEFVSWSDGGARNHTVSFPSSNRTYTATYRAVDGSPTTRTLSSVADAYVGSSGSAANNYGRTGELMVKAGGDSGYNRHAYYKFDLTSLGNIASAKLRLFGRLVSDVASDAVTTGVFTASDAAWSESTLTWNNKPSSGSTALATTRVTAGAARWYEWDLTDYLRQQKAAGKTSVTLVIKNLTVTKASAGFRSKESSSNKPQLVITG
jgi:glucose/arabinose dehydrogenase